MSIIEPAIRPPAEADSFYLQITTGCSANHCTFCGAYQGKPFRFKEEKEIFTDLAVGRLAYPETRRVFLMDGDALVIKNDKLLPILKRIKDAFPLLSRISSYANGYNITFRSNQELWELSNHKLKLIYMGLESGSQTILDYCKKRSSVSQMIEAVHQAEEVGIKASVIVLLGLGGRKYSQIHVEDTIIALNKMQPRYLSFLSLMLVPGTELYHDAQNHLFQELSPLMLLQETYDIIHGLELSKTIFRCDHASNFLPLEGRFPQDKPKLLKILQAALAGKINLKPDYLRGL